MPSLPICPPSWVPSRPPHLSQFHPNDNITKKILHHAGGPPNWGASAAGTSMDSVGGVISGQARAPASCLSSIRRCPGEQSLGDTCSSHLCLLHNRDGSAQLEPASRFCRCRCWCWRRSEEGALLQWVRLVRVVLSAAASRGGTWKGGCGKQEMEGGERGRCDWRGRGLPQWARQIWEEEGVC